MQGLVHIVDDNASYRTAMERRLRHAGYEVATYASAQQLLEHLPSESIPSCVLLDVRIPALSGPELQERLSELGSTLPIIFLTGHPDVRTTVRTIKAGAEDFLTKPVSSDDLLRAIERAIARHEVTRGLKSKLDIVRAHVTALTPRERQVFELVIRGDTNKLIANALGCTVRTIKAHRQKVMEKMQVRTLPELVSLAERIGIASSAGQTAWPGSIEQNKSQAARSVGGQDTVTANALAASTCQSGQPPRSIPGTDLPSGIAWPFLCGTARSRK